MTENKVEVIIGGNIYSLKGEGSQEHIQKVAALIDKKIMELQKSNMTTLNTSKLYMLAAINMADEYLKLKKDYEAYEQELLNCNAENLALKQRLEEISLELAQTKLQVADKTNTNVQSQKEDEHKEDGDHKKHRLNSIKNNIKKNNESSNRGR